MKAEPTASPSVLPDYPAYQQILVVFPDIDRPLPFCTTTGPRASRPSATPRSEHVGSGLQGLGR
ncbi:hypothetical protein ACFQX6_08735 [Streptosporangium lutulentum]